MMQIDVVELFAGVGGFRVGLEAASKEFSNKKCKFNITWSNQWEPNESKQYASQVYKEIWPESNHSNEDISSIDKIPVKASLLVGGFPCQDYSVAKSLSQSHGISGKKGVLWWEIHRLINQSKKDLCTILLENVDRLLGSPAKQRGRDFALMLASLNDLGYIVEWRVINAADYGNPQKRKRVFIFAYKKTTLIKKGILKQEVEWLTQKSIFAQAFPVEKLNPEEIIEKSIFNIEGDLVQITNNFNIENNNNIKFMNTGISINRQVTTIKTKPNYQGAKRVLKDILIAESKVPSDFYIPDTEIKKWADLKDRKAIPRTSKSGTTYLYSEGKMSFPDPIDKPARTIVTGEGGKTPSRFKHVIKIKNRHRRLTPEELEQLNGFEPGHTKKIGISDTKRAFFMGNALVTQIVRDFGICLLKNKDTYYS